jgi:hypothetical protein
MMALLLTACGEVDLDAGSNGGRDGGPIDGGKPPGVLHAGTPSNALNLPCTLPAPDFLAGTWQGQFDTFTLPSGASSIEIEIKGSYEGVHGLCGTVTFGSGDPLPLPTNAEDYPPGLPPPEDIPSVRLNDNLREGFPYEFYSPRSAGVQGDRIRFTINTMQIYNAWCNMQPAYAETDTPSKIPSQQSLLLGVGLPVVGCLPPNSVTDGPGRSCDGLSVQYISCAQLELCLFGFCACTLETQSPDAGCVAQTIANQFDLRATDDSMTGNVVRKAGVESMHLTRIP